MCFSKSCTEFSKAAAADGVEYDFGSRRFVAKDGKEVSGKDRNNGDKSGNYGGRDTYHRRR